MLPRIFSMWLSADCRTTSKAAVCCTSDLENVLDPLSTTLPLDRTAPFTFDWYFSRSTLLGRWINISARKMWCIRMDIVRDSSRMKIFAGSSWAYFVSIWICRFSALPRDKASI